jgi:hypothetical protein
MIAYRIGSKTTKLGWLVLYVLVVQIVFITKVNTAYANLYINEFLPDPDDPNDASEWIELFNSTNKDINLDGYIIDDEEGGSKPYLLTGVIPANGFFIIEKSDSKIILNNDKDAVRLFDPQSVLIDLFEYTKTVTNQTYCRLPDGGPWHTCDSPTKNATNGHPLPTPTLSLTPTLPSYPVFLNEVVACPEKGELEWVELYNPHPHKVTLSGWVFVDASDNRQTIDSRTLEPNNYLVVEFSRAILNNTGDELKLINSGGSLVDKQTLPSCKAGQSWAKDPLGTNWFLTTILTPGRPNQISQSPTPATVAPSKPAASIPEPSTGTTHSPTGVLVDTFSELLNPSDATSSSSYLYKIASIAGIISNYDQEIATVAANHQSVKHSKSGLYLFSSGAILIMAILITTIRKIRSSD